jgi:hypothetical protein
MRHAAVRRAYPGKAPKIHGLAMLRKAPKGKRLFWGGTAVGLVGLPPLAVGTSNLAHGSKVEKAAKIHLRRKGVPACGAHKAMPSTQTTTTTNPEKVTCAKCKAWTVSKAAKERTPQERADRLTQSARRAHAYGIEQARAGNLPGVRRANRVRNARAGRAAMLFVGKADDKRKGFWREGLSGTREALGQRAESYKEPVPAKLRAAQRRAPDR